MPVSVFSKCKSRSKRRQAGEDVQRVNGPPILLIAFLVLGAVGGCFRSSQQADTLRAERVAQCQEHIEYEDWQAANAIIDEMRAADPDCLYAVALSAKILAAQGQPEQALAIIDGATSAGGGDGPALLIEYAAEISLAQQQYEAAVEKCLRLLEMDPSQIRVRRLAAEAYQQLGNRFDGNEQLRALARLAPLTANELWLLISPLQATNENLPRAARLAQGSKRPSVGLNPVRSQYGGGELRSARASLEKLPPELRQQPATVALEGRILLESQQFDAVSAWLQSADTACRRYSDFWVAAGGLALHQSNPTLAVRAFAEALQREPMDFESASRLTQALEAAGDMESAEAMRTRTADLEALIEMAEFTLEYPGISPDAFQILQRELTKIGLVFEAFSWQLLEQQPAGMRGKELRDDETARMALLAESNPSELLSRRICGLDLSDFPADLSVLKTANASSRATPVEPRPNASGQVPKFADVAANVGLTFQYQNAADPVTRHFLLHQALGGGSACLDFDRDGKVDLYVAQGACDPPGGRGTAPNLLARNLGGSFQDVTAAAGADDRGYSMGLTAGDWNQDGFPDLVVGNLGNNRLLINQGDGTFRIEPEIFIPPAEKFTMGLAMADLTGDNLPDLVEVNYTDDVKIFEPIEYLPDGSPARLPGPKQFDAATDRLLINDGKGKAITRAFAAEASSARYGMGVVATDIDEDGRNEVLIGNDQTANQLWDPEQGTAGVEFREVAVARGVGYGRGGTPKACMGIAAADFDGNGRLDFHVTNFDDEWSNHYLQSSNGFFTDLAFPFQLDRTSIGLLGFGAQPLDFDNNSLIDIAIGNGHIEDFSGSGSAFKMPTQILTYDGQAYHASEVEGDPDYWKQTHLSRALTTLDWNRDGRLDFVVTDLISPMSLLENRTSSPYHWVQIELVGRIAERDAIGAKVTVTCTDQQLSGWVTSGDGYMGKNESMLHFGLGATDKIESVEIRWPGGTTETRNDIQPDQRWLIIEGQGKAYRR